MKIKEFFSGPDKWCKDSAAKDEKGNNLSSMENPYSCCLFGAILYCYGETSPESHQIETLIRKEHYSFIAWNDAPERTFEEVKELVERLDI